MLYKYINTFEICLHCNCITYWVEQVYLGCVFRHPATHNVRHRILQSVFRQPFVELRRSSYHYW